MTAKIIKPLPEHKDILGQTLSMGNYVAIARHNSMKIGSIIKMTPKQIRVQLITKKLFNDYLVYPHETLLLAGPDALAYVLKHSGP